MHSPMHTSHSRSIAVQATGEVSLESLESQPEDRIDDVEIQSSPGRKPWLESDKQ